MIPWEAAMAVGMLIGGGVLVAVALLVTSRWWHDRHHRQMSSPVTCDHCSRDRGWSQ
jgi:hypothetical protein